MSNGTEAFGWAPIIKSEKQEDGTLLVTGRVSDGGIDRDQQICDPEWLDRAVPQWFEESGNVREMHTAHAAGTAVSYWKADDGGHMIQAKVVDPTSVSKVEHKVLRGFSVGIKQPRVTLDKAAKGGRIVDGQIIEVSLVDRPANPSCLLTVAKSDDAGLIEVVDEQAFVDLTSETHEVVSMAAEDVRARAQEVLDYLGSLDFGPQGKADSADIAGAQEAIALIARLIQSEAQGLADGRASEAGDISCLLGAVDSLKWFIAREAEEEPAPEVLALSDDEPEVVKAERPGIPEPIIPEEPEAPESVEKADTTDTSAPTGPEFLTKADGDALAAKVEQIVADALAKAEEAHKAEVATLRESLAKVQAQPIPGGPVRVRVKSDQAKADNADRAALLVKADEYLQKADSTPERDLQDGYRAAAARLREQALR